MDKENVCTKSGEKGGTMTTLADVAKRANVSKMTVSRVLNHPEQVTKELRELVLQAMADLDYRPNVVAKALAQQRSLVVKVVILEKMDVVEPYYMNLLAGIAKELERRNYALQLVTDVQQAQGQCDGYIITGMRESDYTWIKELEKPVILFGENAQGIPFVDSDNQKATFEATEYAISRGYEQLVFIGMNLPESFEQAREAGYRQALEGHNLQGTIYQLENRSSQAEAFILNLPHIADNTCFICASDRLALGIERGLQTLGKGIPEEVGIIGFDGVFLDRVASPKLTTMKQSITNMGEICVRQLMTLIDGGRLSQPGHYCQAELVARETTR